jgi:hypothetical protein
MNRGTQAKASMQKPTEGKKDTSKPKGGKVEFGYAGPAHKGTKA